MGLLAPTNALSIYRGASKTLSLTIVKKGEFDDDGNPVPVVLNSVKILFSVKSILDTKPPVIQKSTDDALQLLVTKPYAGQAKVFLLPADTQYLEPGIYTYDVWLYFTLLGSRYIIIEPSQFEVKLPVSFSPL